MPVSTRRHTSSASTCRGRWPRSSAVGPGYAWPRALGAAFTRHNLLTGLGLAVAFTVVMLVATMIATPGAMQPLDRSGDFYAVVPHDVMVGLFGGVFVFVIAALSVGVVRFSRATGATNVASGFSRTGAVSGSTVAVSDPTVVVPGPTVVVSGFSRTWLTLRDSLTLRHLHTSGADCVSMEEERAPWRRWFHHCTFYGFLLCFASTSVAAIYHGVFGWRAPYGYTSLPVVLGTLGGVGLLVGSTGLWILAPGRRDPGDG